MRPLMLAQIARWCEARLIGADVRIDAVGTDTRALEPGSLYVALRGERVDGHDFAAEAAAHGAVALLVSREVDSPLPQLLCGDTEQALGELAAGVQQTRDACVIGVTGSNGKTTVKTLLHGILVRAMETTVTGSLATASLATGSGARAAYANPGNRNNEIGLPLAVLAAPEDAVFAVYEMGAGKPGDIAYLTSIVRPRIALVNNVAPAHLQRMQTLLGVAQTKGAIYEALPADGIAVINADDAFAPYFRARAGSRRQLRFGLDNSAEVTASDVRGDAGHARFRLHTAVGERDIALPLPGRHNVMNALAATALALAAGIELNAIAEGLERAQPVPGRQVAHALGGGAVLIDDSYNANPGSMAAAIALLAGAAAEPGAGAAWLVLGDMAELGAGAEAMHAEIGDRARRAGIARLFTTGLLSRAASRAFGDGAAHFDSRDALIDALRVALAAAGQPVRCLVKGSRSSAMDKVVAALRVGTPSPAVNPEAAPGSPTAEDGHAA